MLSVECFSSLGAGSDLQQELKRQDERSRERERESKDMEDTIDMLRKELHKTEQARKDASIKVKPHTNRAPSLDPHRNHQQRTTLSNSLTLPSVTKIMFVYLLLNDEIKVTNCSFG